jgi:hypothetical protein
MGTAGAFLGQPQPLIKGDRAVGAGIDTELAAVAFSRVDLDQSVFPLADRFMGASRDAGSVITVLAHRGLVGHLDLGDRPMDNLIELVPELARHLHRLGIGHPVVADVLVLTGNLATVTSITLCSIVYKDFHHAPLSTQALKNGP